MTVGERGGSRTISSYSSSRVLHIHTFVFGPWCSWRVIDLATSSTTMTEATLKTKTEFTAGSCLLLQALVESCAQSRTLGWLTRGREACARTMDGGGIACCDSGTGVCGQNL
jgi:hypothetical protein